MDTSFQGMLMIFKNDALEMPRFLARRTSGEKL